MSEDEIKAMQTVVDAARRVMKRPMGADGEDYIANLRALFAAVKAFDAMKRTP